MTLLGLLDAGLIYQFMCYVLSHWREARAMWKVLRWIVAGHGRIDNFALFVLILLGIWSMCVLAMLFGTTGPVTISMVYGEYLLKHGFLIQALPALLRAAAIFFQPQMHRSTGFRKGKEPRKRREPWYGRAKRRRARYKASTYQPQFSFDDEAYDDWYWSHRHKFLHVDHYGHDFGELCRRMSDEELDLLLFGSHAFFSRAAPKRCDWGFLDLQVPLSVQNPTIQVSGPSAVYDCFQAFYTGSQAGNDLPIVFDTGATISVSPYVEDFEDLATKVLSGLILRGITAETSVQGAGTVNWHVRDDSGIIHSIRTRAYYIPNAAARLFSPLAYFRQEENMKKGGAFVFEDRGGYFVFPRTNGKSRLTFNIDHEFPLPISRPERPLSLADTNSDSVFLNVTAPENTNLTPAQKELLRWHFKLGHVNMSWLQKLM